MAQLSVKWQISILGMVFLLNHPQNAMIDHQIGMLHLTLGKTGNGGFLCMRSLLLNYHLPKKHNQLEIVFLSTSYSDTLFNVWVQTPQWVGPNVKSYYNFKQEVK